MWRNTRGLNLTAVLMALWLGAAAAGAEEQVKVTVIAILASTKHKEVCPNLKCLAEKIQELDPTLTGFQQRRMTAKVLAPGGEETFPLIDDQSATVILEAKPQPGKGICVTVKTPGVAMVTYTIKCEKCFPIGTPYVTKKGERLIVGFMVEPVNPKKPPVGKENVKKPKP